MNGVTKTKPEEQPEVAWGPVSSILVTLGVFFGGQILGILLLVFILSIFKSSTLEAVLDTIASTDSGTWYQFLSVIFVEAVTVALLFAFLRGRKASLRSLGFRRFKWVDILWALGGFAVYFVGYLAAAFIAKALIPELDLEQEQELGFSTAVSGLGLIPIFISLVVLPPVVEETLTRGFLYTGLRTKLRPIIATLITSALFAVAHLQWGSEAPLLWIAAIDTFVLSVVLCYLREATERLWAPIFLHGIKNAIAFAALFIFKV